MEYNIIENKSQNIKYNKNETPKKYNNILFFSSWLNPPKQYPTQIN